MLKKKSIFSVPVLLIVFLLTGLFYSCDNVIESHGIYYAPPRYTWDIDTLDFYEYGIIVFDSNSYFTLSAPYLIHYFNNEKTLYSIGNGPQTIITMDGTNENNLYIGGGKYLNGYISYPILTKFNNGTFTQINIGCDTTYRNRVRSIKIINTDIWCGTSNGEVIRYNGSSVDYYCKIDTSHEFRLISTDVYNNLYAIMEKTIKDTNNLPIATSTKVYVYENSDWSLIFQHMSDSTDAIIFYDAIKNRTIGANRNGLFDFSMGIFNKILDENITGVMCYYTGGKSLNDLILFGAVNNNFDSLSIHHWNGISASTEILNVNNQFSYDLSARKFVKNHDRYYLLFYDFFFNSYLLKGTPIKQTKK